MELPFPLGCLSPLPGRETAAPCCSSLANSLLDLTGMVSVYVTRIVDVWLSLLMMALAVILAGEILVSLNLNLDC